MIYCLTLFATQPTKRGDGLVYVELNIVVCSQCLLLLYIIITIIIIIIIIIVIIVIIIIVSIITVFAGVLFAHQPGANHAPRASVTQVNHSVHTLSTFLRIRADPSMQTF